MTRILFYGGCHALVLRDLFAQLFDPSTVELSLLINFQLIQSGQPFPFERLAWCDVFVYSPIQNKGEYNTEHLIERCRAIGTKALCFPWMEWHGYCPSAVKGVFKGRFQWYYPELLRLAGYFDRFDTFFDHVVTHFPADDAIDGPFAESSRRLASSEASHEMPIRICEFIKDNFRASRLFLISDHPSLTLYLHVVEQIRDELGLRRPQTAPSGEPQWRWRTPIFPKVADRLGLSFKDCDWIDDELLPGRTSSFESYLSLYFHKDSVILGPIDDAELTRRSEPFDRTPAGCDTRIVASRVGSGHDAALDEYVCLETLSGMGVRLEPNTRFAIDTRQWRSTWSF